MKIHFDLEDLSYIWSNWTDKQRLAAIKSLILTSPVNYVMVEEVKKMMDSKKFKEMVD